MSRLTKVKSIHNNEPEFYEANIELYPESMGYEYLEAEMDCINKLGKIEDLMEKYKINSIEELENILIENSKELHVIQGIKYGTDGAISIVGKGMLYNKLSEEFGCPLEVFVNIFKYGVIVLDDNYEAKGFSEWQQQNIEIDIKNKCFSVYCIGTWKFRDYGKTWWLKGEKNE